MGSTTSARRQHLDRLAKQFGSTQLGGAGLSDSVTEEDLAFRPKRRPFAHERVTDVDSVIASLAAAADEGKLATRQFLTEESLAKVQLTQEEESAQRPVGLGDHLRLLPRDSQPQEFREALAAGSLLPIPLFEGDGALRRHRASFQRPTTPKAPALDWEGVRHLQDMSSDMSLMVSGWVAEGLNNGPNAIHNRADRLEVTEALGLAEAKKLSTFTIQKGDPPGAGMLIDRAGGPWTDPTGALSQNILDMAEYSMKRMIERPAKRGVKLTPRDVAFAGPLSRDITTNPSYPYLEADATWHSLAALVASLAYEKDDFSVVEDYAFPLAEYLHPGAPPHFYQWMYGVTYSRSGQSKGASINYGLAQDGPRAVAVSAGLRARRRIVFGEAAIMNDILAFWAAAVYAWIASISDYYHAHRIEKDGTVSEWSPNRKIAAMRQLGMDIYEDDLDGFDISVRRDWTAIFERIIPNYLQAKGVVKDVINQMNDGWVIGSPFRETDVCGLYRIRRGLTSGRQTTKEEGNAYNTSRVQIALAEALRGSGIPETAWARLRWVCDELDKPLTDPSKKLALLQSSDDTIVGVHRSLKLDLDAYVATSAACGFTAKIVPGATFLRNFNGTAHVHCETHRMFWSFWQGTASSERGDPFSLHKRSPGHLAAYSLSWASRLAGIAGLPSQQLAMHPAWPQAHQFIESGLPGLYPNDRMIKFALGGDALALLRLAAKGDERVQLSDLAGLIDKDRFRSLIEQGILTKQEADRWSGATSLHLGHVMAVVRDSIYNKGVRSSALLQQLLRRSTDYADLVARKGVLKKLKLANPNDPGVELAAAELEQD